MVELFYSPIDPVHSKKEKNRGRELRKSQWWKLKLTQGLCHYCQTKFKPADLTMDHVVPVARGGFSSKGNVVVSCKTCNSRKKLKIPAELALESL